MKTMLRLLLCGAGVIWVMPSYATIWNLFDENSNIAISDGTIHGAFSWSVENPTIHKGGGGNFWYREGATGGEGFLGSVVPVSASQSASNFLSVTYDLGNFELKADYELQGGAVGSMESKFFTTIIVSNSSPSSLDLNLFQTWNTGFGSITNNLLQVLGGNTIAYQEGMFRGKTIFSLTPDHIIVSSDSELVAGPGGLGDGSPTTFPDIAGPVGPGVLREGYQWNLTLGAGETQIFTVEHHVFVVPEPSTIILMMIAGLGCWLKRRKINVCYDSLSH